MSEYKSDIKQIAAPASAVFGRLSNLENLKTFVDNLPEDQIPADKLAQIKQMELTPDSISMPGGPTGKVTLNVVERKPDSLIVMRPSDVPIDLNLEIRIGEEDGERCTLQVAIVADLPMMLRHMVKGPFNQLVAQFADMLAAIPYNNTPAASGTEVADE